MGGGTVKFAICQSGKVTKTAALDVGARLVVVDEGQRVIGLEKASYRIAERIGLKLTLGERVETEQMQALAAHMVEQLLHVMRLEPLPPSTQDLLRTPPLGYHGTVDGIVFSGGVSEFIYDRQSQTFGDLGQLLATEMRARLPRDGVEVLEPRAGIRATVIGASQYTVQVSGSTIYISSIEAARALAPSHRLTFSSSRRRTVAPWSRVMLVRRRCFSACRSSASAMRRSRRAG